MEIDIKSISELEPGKFYHVNCSAEIPIESLRSFALSLKKNDIRAIITIGEIKIEALKDLFAGMSDDDRSLLINQLSIPRKTREISWESQTVKIENPLITPLPEGQEYVEINPLDHEQTK